MVHYSLVSVRSTSRGTSTPYLQYVMGRQYAISSIFSIPRKPSDGEQRRVSPMAYYQCGKGTGMAHQRNITMGESNRGRIRPGNQIIKYFQVS